MTREETKQLLMMIQAIYPNFSVENKTITVNAWEMLLGEYDYQMLTMALKVYATTNTSGFAPVPSQLIEEMQKLKPNNELNEMEAWVLVSRAIRNSSYNSLQEFVKLPEIVQKCVGSATQLHIWAIDQDYNESVVSSNFIKTYRAVLQRERQMKKLPSDVKLLIEKINSKTRIGDNSI